MPHLRGSVENRTHYNRDLHLFSLMPHLRGSMPHLRGSIPHLRGSSLKRYDAVNYIILGWKTIILNNSNT